MTEQPQKKKPLRKAGKKFAHTSRRGAQRRGRSPHDIVCALCDEPMAGEPEWVGDIEVALSSRDGSPGNSRKIHQSCGEAVPELVKNTLEKMNRRQPELRLRMWPWPALSAPYREPLPNLVVCREYFDRYKSAQLEVDALRLISDLLLELRSKHSVEWECCGWKSDAITDVVLGHTPTGYVENGSGTARDWFTRHWIAEKKRDREIEARFSPERLRAADAAWDIDHFQLTRKYDQFAIYVRWLEGRWRKLGVTAPGRFHGSAADCLGLCEASAKNFRKERPRFPIEDKELQQIAAAYARCCTKAAPRPTASQVVLDFVAKAHQVSPRLVASVRSESKKNARP